MEYKSWQQKTFNWSYEEDIWAPVKIFKLSHETALRTSSNCPGQEGEAHLSDIKPSRRREEEAESGRDSGYLWHLNTDLW